MSNHGLFNVSDSGWLKACAVRIGQTVTVEGVPARVVWAGGIDLGVHTIVLDDDRRVTCHPCDRVEVNA